MPLHYSTVVPEKSICDRIKHAAYSGKAACAQFGLDQFQIVCGQCVNVYLCQSVCAYVPRCSDGIVFFTLQKPKTKHTHYTSTHKLRSM